MLWERHDVVNTCSRPDRFLRGRFMHVRLLLLLLLLIYGLKQRAI